MSWFNIYGFAAILLIMVPNVLFAVKNKDGFANKPCAKYVEVIEQIGRFGCFGFMIFNIPYTYFGWWFNGAFTVYIVALFGFTAVYCAIWAVFFKKNCLFRALALSIIPSVIFIFCGITILSVPLIIAAVLFAPSHIYISYINAA